MEYEIIGMRKGSRKKCVQMTVDFLIAELNLLSSKMQLVVLPQKNFVKTHGYAGAVAQITPGLITLMFDSRLTFEKLVTTLCHEMVHVKQEARGQMASATVRGKTVRYWMGRKVSATTHYVDLPWEQEAFKREKLLVNSYLKSLGAI